MTQYSLILFDLDGTLTDPWEGITRSVQFALAKMNVDEPDRRNLTRFIGPPLAESFADFYSFSPEQAWAAVEYYREYFSRQGMYENEVYPGIPELLGTLQTQGVSLALATSKPTVFSEEILRHFKLDSYFSVVVGSNLDGSRVAKSEIIKVAVDHFGSEEPALMVGDRRHDIIGAQANGIDSAGVAYGYGSREELEQAGPTYLVANVHELGRLLTRN